MWACGIACDLKKNFVAGRTRKRKVNQKKDCVKRSEKRSETKWKREKTQKKLKASEDGRMKIVSPGSPPSTLSGVKCSAF